MKATRPFAIACAEACDEKKATGIVVLDVRKLTSIADYFVVASVSNERQARAIAEELRGSLGRMGLRELGIEGLGNAHWVLQDFGDVVVHLFHESQRGFYDLEGLWADARRVRWEKAAPKA